MLAESALLKQIMGLKEALQEARSHAVIFQVIPHLIFPCPIRWHEKL
jgi:hypothetical protein